MKKKANAGIGLKGNIRQYTMLIALVAVIVLFQFLTGDKGVGFFKRFGSGILLQPNNISNIIQQNAYVLILAVGMLLCILTVGNIDLSVGSIVAVVGAISAVMVLKWDYPVWISIVVGLIVGVIIGAWHGFWIAYVGIPAFIVTLAGMLIFRGFTMVILGGTSLAPLPTNYTFMAAGFVPDIASIEGINLLALLAGVAAVVAVAFSESLKRANKKKYKFDTEPFWAFVLKIVGIGAAIMAFTYALAKYKGLPVVLIIVVVLVLIYTFITTKTIPGRHIYAYGGNPRAAELSGVKTKKVLFWVYVNMGLLSALAGIVFTGRLNSATPKAGNGFELDAIASCFIGGASTTGGVGTVIGAIIGGLLMGVLNNGMSIMGVTVDWQQTIKGFVLLLAVAFDVLSKARTK